MSYKSRGENMSYKSRGENMSSKSRGENMSYKSRGENMSSKSIGENMSYISRGENMSSKSRGENISSIAGTKNINQGQSRVKKRSQGNGYRESSSGLLLQATSIISGTSKETALDLKVAKRLRDGASARKISCHQNHQKDNKRSSLLLCPSHWFVRRRERETDQKKETESGQDASCENIGCEHGAGCGQGMGCGHGTGCEHGCGDGVGCGQGNGCGHLAGCGHWTGRCMWRICFLCFCLPVCYPCFLSRTLRKVLKESPHPGLSPPLPPDPLRRGNKDIIQSSSMSRGMKITPTSEEGVLKSPAKLNVIFLQTERSWEIVELLNNHHLGLERKTCKTSEEENIPGSNEEKLAHSGDFYSTVMKKIMEEENGATTAKSEVISKDNRNTNQESVIEPKAMDKPSNDLETISEEVSLDMTKEVITSRPSLTSSVSDVFYSLEGSEGSCERGQETLACANVTCVSDQESQSASLRDSDIFFDTSHVTPSFNIYEKSSNLKHKSQKSKDHNKNLLSPEYCAKPNISSTHREEVHMEILDTEHRHELVDIDNRETSFDPNISEPNEDYPLSDISYFLFDHLMTIDNHWSASLSLSAELPLADWSLQHLSSTCFSTTDIIVVVFREETELNGLLERKTGMLGYSRHYWTGFFPLLLVQLVGEEQPEKVGSMNHGIIEELSDKFSAIHRILVHSNRTGEASFLLSSLLKFQLHVQQCVKLGIGSRGGRKGGVESKFMSLLFSTWECSGPCQLTMVSPISGENVGNRLRRKKFFQSVRKQMTIRRKKASETEEK